MDQWFWFCLLWYRLLLILMIYWDGASMLLYLDCVVWHCSVLSCIALLTLLIFTAIREFLEKGIPKWRLLSSETVYFELVNHDTAFTNNLVTTTDEKTGEVKRRYRYKANNWSCATLFENVSFRPSQFYVQTLCILTRIFHHFLRVNKT